MASGRFRTKLCRNYALGNCPQGDQCKYLHSRDIPVSTPYPMAQPMVPVIRGVPGFNPRFSFPLPAAAPSFMWPTLSPPPAPADMSNFGWIYQSIPPSAPSPTAASQPPQFRPLSWRTTLCRHFVKNQGWCPLGDDCGYIHDIPLAMSATKDVRFPNDPTVGQGESYGTARGRAASKHSHCWAYVQGLCRVRDCPYLHPEAVQLFVPHTPCLAWPNCIRGPLCAYKHPEPLIPKLPEIRTAPRPPPVQMQPQSPVQLSPVQVIPSGTVQYHGTTYFPVGSGPTSAPAPPPAHQHVPQRAPAAAHAPAPAPVPAVAPPPPSNMSSPHYTWSYPSYSPLVTSVASGYSPYSPESVTFHSPYYETISSLPASSVPRAFSAPVYEELHSVSGAPMAALPPIQEPAIEEPEKKETEKQEESLKGDEFPYRAVAGQRAGHARRVSVQLKSKEDTDAVGVLPLITTRRESWMGHKPRDDPSHRSWPWAPDTTSGFGHSHSLQLML
ncbi:hypothetical protein BDW22DRAFT_731432 [Trametopsis cervina]|nr:hypothetical protein BDW22DRAFT_731432 [Trametopsis cervina]